MTIDEHLLIRRLAILILTDENGINQESYDQMLHLLNEEDADIIDRVEATDGRYYLPDN